MWVGQDLAPPPDVASGGYGRSPPESYGLSDGVPVADKSGGCPGEKKAGCWAQNGGQTCPGSEKSGCRAQKGAKTCPANEITGCRAQNGGQTCPGGVVARRGRFRCPGFGDTGNDLGLFRSWCPCFGDTGRGDLADARARAGEVMRCPDMDAPRLIISHLQISPRHFDRGSFCNSLIISGREKIQRRMKGLRGLVGPEGAGGGQRG